MVRRGFSTGSMSRQAVIAMGGNVVRSTVSASAFAGVTKCPQLNNHLLQGDRLANLRQGLQLLADHGIEVSCIGSLLLAPRTHETTLASLEPTTVIGVAEVAAV